MNNLVKNMASSVVWKGPRIIVDNLDYYLIIKSPNCVNSFDTSQIKDISGSDFIPNLVNNPQFQPDFGGIISFDGTNQHINTGLSSSAAFFSVNILMKATNTTGTQVYVGSNNGVNDWWIGLSSGNFVFSANGSVVNSSYSVGTTSFYLVTTTFSPDSRKIYINGTLQASASPVSLSNPGNIHIAKFGDNNTFYAAMSLGAFIFYSKELNSTEVSQIYNSLNGSYGLI